MSKSTTSREMRAYQQSGQYIVFPSLDGETVWTVQRIHHPNAGTAYNVDVAAGTCTCPDHQQRGTRCKHQALVGFHLQADERPAPKPQPAPKMSSERRSQAERDIAALWG